MPDPPSASSPDKENVVSLSRFRARHARGLRQKQLDGLLDDARPEQAIRSLPADDLYALLRGAETEEKLELLAHARVEQIQVVLDLALWTGDRLAVDHLTEWVDLMAALPFETVGRWIAGLDIELVALLIRKGARIYDLEIEPPPDEPEGTFYPTPDGFFVLDVVGYRADAEAIEGWREAPPVENGETLPSGDALIRVVANLYRADINLARRILVGAKAELDSGLEELALRWRRGRLEDLGVEDEATAREIYRELDPASVTIGELRPGTRVRSLHVADADDARLPVALAAELEGDSMFARALTRVTSPAEQQELQAALVALANRVLAAAGEALGGEEEVVAGHLAHMRATLDLGVEYFARQGGGSVDEERAVDAVRTVSLARLFRVGVSLIGKVRKLGRTLRQRGPFASVAQLDLVEEPEATVLASVNRVHPVYPQVLDSPPGGGERPISSLAELALITAAIERAAAAQAMLLGLGVTPARLDPAHLEGTQPADRVAIDTALLARTAIALALLADAPAGPSDTDGFRALTPAEVKRIDKLLSASTSTAALERARGILLGLSPPRLTRAAREMTERWLASLQPLQPLLVRPAPGRASPRRAP